MLTFISLNILLTHTAMAAPALTGPQQMALQDEVNVLVYGVVQFSTELHEFYVSTAQTLDRIRDRADLCKQGLRMLHRQAQSAQQKQQEIRGILEGMQAQDTMLRTEAQRNKEALQEMRVGHQNLAQRLKALEETLSRMEEQGYQEREAASQKMKSHTGGRVNTGNLGKGTVAKHASRRQGRW